MATNNFDFDSYNAIIKTANSGLKLFLAEQLLLDVQQVMVRFKSPLHGNMESICDEVAQLRADNKKYLASRERAGNTEAIDNPTESKATVTSSADYGRNSDYAGPQATTAKLEQALGSAPL